MPAVNISDIILFHPSTWAAWLPEEVYEKIPANTEVAIGTLHSLSTLSTENEYKEISMIEYIIFDRERNIYFGNFTLLSEEEIVVQPNAKDIVYSTLLQAISDDDDPSAA